MFKEFPGQPGKSGEEQLQLRGDDRVDNVPLEIRMTRTGLIAQEPIEFLLDTTGSVQ